jgi:DNA-binding beta-propeller fold protein YncE
VEPDARICEYLRVRRRVALLVSWLLTPGFWLLLPLLPGCGRSDAPEAVWGHTGGGAGEFAYPRAIAGAADGTFFVIDRAARVQRFSADFKFLNGWRMPEWAQGKPVGLTVGPNCNLWVADTHYHRVIVYASDGRELRRFGTHGTGPGEFDLPTDVAFDADGNVYVSEYGENNRIQVFDRDLKFLRSFGELGTADGQLSRPQSIGIIGDMLYVTDSCNHRIAKFDLHGRWLGQIGQTGSAAGEFRFPYGLDVDENGKLLVSEFGNNRVQRIDPATGAPLATWGRTGRLPGELSYAWAVQHLPGNGAIVVDAGNHRLQKIRLVDSDVSTSNENRKTTPGGI